MAGTYTRSKQGVQGDVRVVYYDVTNFTDSETLTVAELNKIFHVSATIGTADKSVGMGVSGNVITFATSADSFDGTLKVEGK